MAGETNDLLVLVRINCRPSLGALPCAATRQKEVTYGAPPLSQPGQLER